MNKSFYFFFTVFIFKSVFILAQKDVLIQEKNQIIQEIAYIKDQINQTELDKKSNLKVLLLYEKDVELRESLIKNYESDIIANQSKLDSLPTSLNNLYTREDSLGLEINSVETKISNLSNLFNQTILQIYLSQGDENLLYLILETSSFDQMINQYLYLKKIQNTAQTLSNKLKLEKAILDSLEKELKSNKNQIEQSITQSNKLIQNKQLAIQEKEFQLDSLNIQSELKKELINSLSTQIELLKQEVLDKEKIAKQIENEIIKLNKENNPIENSADFNLSTLNFEKEKGNLDWPADNCVVLSGFGTVRHREYPDLQDVNRGIILAIPKGNVIKPVFSGYISNVLFLPNALKAIIIQHGIYSTVYSQLDETYVQIGDFVTKNDPIGSLHIEENHKTGLMEFQVWKEIEPINPKIWLKKH